MKAALVLVSSCLGLLPGAGRVAAPEPEMRAPDFSLPGRGSGQKVSLAELKGRIVLLDFFAHWCVPCVRGSGEVETGIRQYYQAKILTTTEIC